MVFLTLRGKNSLELSNLLLVAALSMLLSFGTVAQNSAEPVSVEEILVTGDLSLRAMKNQTVDALDEVMDLYNEVYAGTDYEMICRRERPFKDGFDPIPIQRTVRICDTSFVREIETQATEDYLLGFGNGSTRGSLTDIERHIDEVDQKMAELIQADPVFRQKVIEWDDLKASYETALASDKERGFWSSLFRPVD